MSFIVSTDAAADLGLDYIKQKNIKVISMKYTLGKEEYSFGNGEKGLNISEFYKTLKSGVQAKTMLVNTEQHKDHFIELFKLGLDIIHVPLSSGLSGTSACAEKAVEELRADYPDRKIAIIDFKGASMGQGLFVDYLAEMRDSGKTFEETKKWAQENALHLCHFFTVDDLGHLRRGGRISGFSSFVGSILKIKPLLHVDNDGKLVPITKIMGRKKALHSLVDMMKEKTDGKKQRVFISHGDCIEDANEVARLVTESFGITDITIGYIGQIVGLHSGPGTVALFFMGKDR